MCPLYTYPYCGYSWSIDKSMCCLHQGDGNPTLDISTIHLLGCHHLVTRTLNRRFKVSLTPRPESCQKIRETGISHGSYGGKTPHTSFFLLLRFLEDLPWVPMDIRGHMSIHDTNVVHNVGLLFTEVLDNKVLLFSIVFLDYVLVLVFSPTVYLPASYSYLVCY